MNPVLTTWVLIDGTKVCPKLFGIDAAFAKTLILLLSLNVQKVQVTNQSGENGRHVLDISNEKF